jgi:flagella basal body P-ring formation protein FlgA
LASVNTAARLRPLQPTPTAWPWLVWRVLCGRTALRFNARWGTRWTAGWALALAGWFVGLGPSAAAPALADGAAARLTEAPAAGAATLAEAIQQGQQLLAQAAQQQAQKAGWPAQARVVVLPGMPDARLKLAPCAQVQAFVPAGNRPWGATRLGLRCLQLASTAPAGGRAWSISLPAQVKVFAPAPVAATALPVGTVLESTHLAVDWIDWAAHPSVPVALADSLWGRPLLRPLAAGQALRPGDLRARQWFASGDTVRVTAVGPGFHVQREGVALVDGFEGQVARVKLDNGQVVQGLPQSERRLEMRL